MGRLIHLFVERNRWYAFFVDRGQGGCCAEGASAACHGQGGTGCLLKRFDRGSSISTFVKWQFQWKPQVSQVSCDLRGNPVTPVCFFSAGKGPTRQGLRALQPRASAFRSGSTVGKWGAVRDPEGFHAPFMEVRPEGNPQRGDLKGHQWRRAHVFSWHLWDFLGKGGERR